MLRTCLTAVIILVVWSGVANLASAQRRVPGYRSQSRLSPYLFRGAGGGGLTQQYFGFIQPRQQMGQFVTRQDVRNNELRAGQLNLERNITRINTVGATQPGAAEAESGLSVRQGSVSTFTTGGYLNYAQYFQTFSQPATRRR